MVKVAAVPRPRDLRKLAAELRAEAGKLEVNAARMLEAAQRGADAAIARARHLRATAEQIEAAPPVDQNTSRLLAPHGTNGITMAGTNAEANPIAHAARIEAITRKARAEDQRPFIRWIGVETLDSWAARHTDADGNPLKIDRLKSYLRRDPATRTAAPGWFREMVYKESGGAVPMSSWDDAGTPSVRRHKK